MTEEIKKDEEKEIADKALVDEIADIDFTGDDKPLDTSTEEESETVENEEKDETVNEDEKSVDESKEVSDDEKKTKEDTKTSEEKEDEKVSTEAKGEKVAKSEEDEETKGETSQVDKLMAEIERLSGLVPAKPVEKPSEKEGDEKTPVEETIYDFIKDIDMDDVSSDPKVFNKILHAVVAKVQQQTTEKVLLSIPQVVMSQVQQQTYFKRMADQFYEDNKDLVNVKQVVRACAQQVQKDNPEWEVEKVFTETAKKTRETLGMSAHTVVSNETVPSAEDVAFAKSKGGSKSNLKRQKSSLQSEIDEL